MHACLTTQCVARRVEFGGFEVENRLADGHQGGTSLVGHTGELQPGAISGRADGSVPSGEDSVRSDSNARAERRTGRERSSGTCLVVGGHVTVRKRHQGRPRVLP